MLSPSNVMSKYDFSQGVRGEVWFSFEDKNHPNCKIKKPAVWFG